MIMIIIGSELLISCINPLRLLNYKLLWFVFSWFEATREVSDAGKRENLQRATTAARYRSTRWRAHSASYPPADDCRAWCSSDDVGTGRSAELFWYAGRWRWELLLVETRHDDDDDDDDKNCSGQYRDVKAGDNAERRILPVYAASASFPFFVFSLFFLFFFLTFFFLFFLYFVTRTFLLVAESFIVPSSSSVLCFCVGWERCVVAYMAVIRLTMSQCRPQIFWSTL